MGRRTSRASEVPAGARALLLLSARAKQTVTYGTLMKAFRVSRGRALSKLIEAVDVAEYGRGAPGFAAIIVRKDTGFPGGGYFCGAGVPRGIRRSAARSTDPKLSRAEREYVRARQLRLWAYYGS